MVPAPPPVALARAAEASRPKGPKTVTVRKGDTLARIAGRSGCSSKQIASANGLRAPHYPIKPGQVLKLTCAAP